MAISPKTMEQMLRDERPLRKRQRSFGAVELMQAAAKRRRDNRATKKKHRSIQPEADWRRLMNTQNQEPMNER